MAEAVPQLKLSHDKLTSVRVWNIRFNSYCLMQDGWRDITKGTDDPDH